MVANQSPVLIKVLPPPGSTTSSAWQHYADGHTDNEGPLRADLAKHFTKWAVNFSTMAALEAPATVTPPTSDHASFSPAKTTIIPPAHEKNPPPVTWPKIYMQSHMAAAKENKSITIISSSSENSPMPMRKSCKQPQCWQGSQHSTTLWQWQWEGWRCRQYLPGRPDTSLWEGSSHGIVEVD